MYTIWFFNSLPWKITMLLIGKPSISMGHGFHGYVSHNQRVLLLGITCITPKCWMMGMVCGIVCQSSAHSPFQCSQQKIRYPQEFMAWRIPDPTLPILKKKFLVNSEWQIFNTLIRLTLDTQSANGHGWISSVDNLAIQFSNSFPTINSVYPLVIEHSYGKSPCSMGKSTISMVMFNCYFDITRG